MILWRIQIWYAVLKISTCYAEDGHTPPFPEFSFDRQQYLGIPGSMDNIADSYQYPWQIHKAVKERIRHR